MNYELLVVGGGPAGVSAALYARARGVKVAIIERDCVGGLVGKVSKVSHFVSVTPGETGLSFAQKLQRQLAEADIPVISDEIVEFDLVGKQLRGVKHTYSAGALVLAMGSSPKIPELVHNDLIATCLPKDLNELRDKLVVIAGGSDGAAKEALCAAQLAREVHMVQIADGLLMIDEFRQLIAANPRIKIHLQAELANIDGSTEPELVEICQRDGTTTSLRDNDGIKVFAYIGQTPNTSALSQQIELQAGFIPCQESETGIAGVFACGDICVKKVRQVATAVADGCIAGVKAASYLSELAK